MARADFDPIPEHIVGRKFRVTRHRCPRPRACPVGLTAFALLTSSSTSRDHFAKLASCASRASHDSTRWGKMPQPRRDFSVTRVTRLPGKTSNTRYPVRVTKWRGSPGIRRRMDWRSKLSVTRVTRWLRERQGALSPDRGRVSHAGLDTRYCVRGCVGDTGYVRGTGDRRRRRCGG